MYFDDDIKIAGDKPSFEINKDKSETDIQLPADKVKAAREAGRTVARHFLKDADVPDENTPKDFELLRQRRLLLSFAATVGFEMYIKDDTLSGIAQKSFLDAIRASSDEVYRSSSDTGAFSFYYLAYRRGNDTERRIGQTFAMLCSHDGDPIFQELGEALYCWFLSVVRKAAESANI